MPALVRARVLADTLALPDLQPPRLAAPVVRELPADLDTPTSVYLKLRGRGPSFLLESVEGGERVARYSFIGVTPSREYMVRGRVIQRRAENSVHTLPLDPGSDPLDFLQQELSQFRAEHIKGLPRFVGGLVGYLGYETVRHFEPKLEAQLPAADLPDAAFLLADTLAAFDHARRSLFLITHAFDGDAAAAERRLDELEELLRGPVPNAPSSFHDGSSEAQSNLTQAEYESLVRRAKEHIAAGDIFQVVLSQRFTRRTGAAPFDIYRAVRRMNPSPYMFFFDFGGALVEGEPFYLVGASPEMFVRLDSDGRAHLRPIAGTRPRGHTPAEDAALEQELLADPKERAEHLMLVDLGRNDLGRVCDYGSIRVRDFFVVELYSHVMHIVSHVEGKLREGLTAFDLVRASFPAGTVSGAPKVRAMEIIGDLEPTARGPYSGCVGYFSFDGAMDMCLAIRTLVGRGNTVSVQAGAGIVADSDPAREYEETVNKAKAMMRAIELAEGQTA
jgi:anthranilate synthase component 1